MLLASIILIALPATSCGEKLKPALVALQQKDPSKAASILSAIREECSQTGGYLELLGATSELLGRPTEAEDAYRQAVSLEPKNSRYRFELGAVYLEDRKPELALDQLKRALELDPSNSAGKKYLIGAYVALRDWQNAGQVFQTMGAFTHPHLVREPPMVLWFAQVLIATKRTALIDSLISPDDPAMTPALLFSLGGLFADQRMYGEVVRFLSRISEQDADDAVYFNLGEAYSHLQAFDKARACYFHAIDKHPGHAGAYFHVGVDFASSGQARKSVPWLIRAHDFAPNDPDIAYALTEQFINLGYFDSANQLLKGVENNASGNALILAAAGDLKSAEGQGDAAIRFYNEALAQTPGLVEALVGRSRVQLAQAKYAEAQQSLELALSMAPGNAAAEGELGLLECRNGQWDSAAVHLDNAWKQDQSNPQIGLELARAYSRTGKLAEALHLLISSEPLLRNLPAFHLELSQLYGQMHRTHESEVELDAFNALQTNAANSLRFEDPRTYVF